MSNSKISALTSATTPLAGTETLPIVQSSTTKQVSVANLTAGRAVSMSSATLTGGTVNGVLYLNASQVATSGSSFTFDGSNEKIVATSSSVQLWKDSTPTKASRYAFNTNFANAAEISVFDGSAWSQSFTVDATGYASWVLNGSEVGRWTTTGLGVGVTPTQKLQAAGLILTSGGASGLAVTRRDTDALAWQWYSSAGNFQAYSHAAGADVVTMASTGNVTFNTGNLVQGTAAKGINFTANTAAAGMTSQLLNWYEEGTWTATLASSGGGSVSLGTSCVYTRIGRVVNIIVSKYALSLSGLSAGNLTITGLPFTCSSLCDSMGMFFITGTSGGANTPITASAPGSTTINLYKVISANENVSFLTVADLASTVSIAFSLTYIV